MKLITQYYASLTLARTYNFKHLLFLQLQVTGFHALFAEEEEKEEEEGGATPATEGDMPGVAGNRSGGGLLPGGAATTTGAEAVGAMAIIAGLLRVAAAPSTRWRFTTCWSRSFDAGARRDFPPPPLPPAAGAAAATEAASTVKSLWLLLSAAEAPSGLPGDRRGTVNRTSSLLLLQLALLSADDTAHLRLVSLPKNTSINKK